MGAIQVKNVPEDLHEALRRRAAREGMDLQSYLLQVIRRELSLPSETEWRDELRAQPTAIGLPAAAEMLRAGRADRERHLDGRGDRH
ncbi:MAG: FitA-like ribbon-helix-helix domain-containing protein [Pseudonocardiaceae bacterium]